MQAFRTKIGNYELQGYEYGDSKQPVLVCLHGMTGDSKSFLGLIDFLKHDFRLIFIDGPGHGESDPFDREEDYSFSSLAKLIHQIVEEKTPEPYYILGHSWGADIALQIARRFPEKIEGLILLDGGYVFPEHARGDDRRESADRLGRLH